MRLRGLDTPPLGLRCSHVLRCSVFYMFGCVGHAAYEVDMARLHKAVFWGLMMVTTIVGALQ